MKDDIKCLKCGSDSSYFDYYESGDYLKTSEIIDDMVITFDSEPGLNENDSGVVCNCCHTYKEADKKMSEEKVFRVIIAGGRTFNDYMLLMKTMDFLLLEKIKEGYKIIIIEGEASGVDTLGKRYAVLRGFEVDAYPADWNNVHTFPCLVRYNKHGEPYNALAGTVRNEQMARNANAAVIFWDGKSTGSKNMIDNAKKYGLELKVINY